MVVKTTEVAVALGGAAGWPRLLGKRPRPAAGRSTFVRTKGTVDLDHRYAYHS